jgi:two-component system sensor histidine kinase BaeS
MARARLEALRRAPRFAGRPPELGRERRGGRGDFGRPGRGDPDRGELPPRGPGREGRGGFEPAAFRAVRPAPVVVGGELAAVVVVPAQAPFGFLLGRFAPTLALAAAGVLIVGTLLTSVMIFRPARHRLLELEDAARRLGSGDLSARAPDRGGDEIAAFARAFNAMAADLARRADALAASDRLRRQLLADVSHELTTPVTAMRGYLETLTMPELTLDQETRARYLGIIGDETARLERIIGDLLDLARLDSGGGPIALQPVAVAQLFERVAARHEPACRSANVVVTKAIASGAETVMGDRDRLEQALQNLAANALRYAPPGTAVKLSAQPSAEGIDLSVEDEGPGIDPAHLPHVFDRFYKADQSRTGTSGGSGLGLSIVKAIVERHGGRVLVESRPGRTVFTIAGLRQPAAGA